MKRFDRSYSRISSQKNQDEIHSQLHSLVEYLVLSLEGWNYPQLEELLSSVYLQMNYLNRRSSRDLYLMPQLHTLPSRGSLLSIACYRYSACLYLIPLYFQVIIYDFCIVIYLHGISSTSTCPCFFTTSWSHRYHHASYNSFCITRRKMRSEAVSAYISAIILLGYDQQALGRDRIIHIIPIRFHLILLYSFCVNFFYLSLLVEKQAYDYILRDSVSITSVKVEI